MIIKYSREGVAQWCRQVGGSNDISLASVCTTEDGGCIVVGAFSRSINVGNQTIDSVGGKDGIAIKYSLNGDVEWAKSYGETSDDSLVDVISTNDGGYVLTGMFQYNISIIAVVAMILYL